MEPDGFEGIPEADLAFAASVFVARPPEVLYAMVSDITRMGQWSPVCRACFWESDARGVGAWFVGRNERPERTWETRSLVVADEPGREFAWAVYGDRARWGYAFRPVEGGTEVTESWQFLPGGKVSFRERYGDDARREVAARVSAARTGIPATLAAIKRAAEAG